MQVSPQRLLFLALPALLALVSACDGARDGASSAASLDSARLATANAPPPARPARVGPRADGGGAPATPAGTPGGTPGPTGPALEALCAGVVAAAGRALEITLIRDSGSTFPAPREGERWSGCLLRGSGTVLPYSSPELMPDRKLIAAMPREGWVEDVTFEASGPEGSAFALRRGQALCHYNILFPDTPGDDEGGDDTTAPADTSTAPLRYLVEILCTLSGPPRGALSIAPA